MKRLKSLLQRRHIENGVADTDISETTEEEENVPTPLTDQEIEKLVYIIRNNIFTKVCS